MLLKGLTLENFKGVKEPIYVEFKPITLLFGPNSAGKSTIVQALHYTHEIFERNNPDPDKTLHGGQVVSLGGFETFVHQHDKSLPVKLAFDLDLGNEELPQYRLGYVTSYSSIESCFPLEENPIDHARIEVSISWSELFQKPVINYLRLDINGNEFTLLGSNEQGTEFYVEQLNTNHPIFPRNENENTSQTEAPMSVLALYQEHLVKDAYNKGASTWFYLENQKTPIPQKGKVLSIREDIWQENVDRADVREFTEQISQLIVGPIDLLRAELRNFLYIGPLREVPSRDYSPARTPDESRWARGLAAWDTLYQASPDFLEKMNQWLAGSDYLSTGYRIDVRHYKELDTSSPFMLALRQGRSLDEDEELTQQLDQLPTYAKVFLQDETNGVEVMPQDVGVGISQLIPVLVAALDKQAGIIAIEQPELHIHPAWQVVLGDLFLRQIREKDSLFLIETHSEHLVLRIMRRIRETYTNELPPGAPEAGPDDVAVIYVESDNGRTIARDMPLNEAGELVKAWPGGFFEERLPEVL